jgi:hypothetical protein
MSRKLARDRGTVKKADRQASRSANYASMTVYIPVSHAKRLHVRFPRMRIDGIELLPIDVEFVRRASFGLLTNCS